MRNSILKKLPLVKRHLQSYLNDEFKDLNLKSSEMLFMNILYVDGDKSQAEITHDIECDKAHTHRIVFKLLNKNLIKYVGDKGENKRNSKLTLTDEGKKIACKFDKAINSWHKLMIEGISKEDLATTKKVIEKIIENATNLKNMEKKNV